MSFFCGANVFARAKIRQMTSSERGPESKRNSRKASAFVALRDFVVTKKYNVTNGRIKTKRHSITGVSPLRSLRLERSGRDETSFHKTSCIPNSFFQYLSVVNGFLPLNCLSVLPLLWDSLLTGNVCSCGAIATHHLTILYLLGIRF